MTDIKKNSEEKTEEVSAINTEFKQNNYLVRLFLYLREHGVILFILLIILILAYGFELFNFNLTIDEEVETYRTGNTLWFVSIGRWGMYFLNKLLLPNPIIPVLPLFLTILFQLTGIFLLIESWGIKKKVHKLLITSIFLTFPLLAHMYIFSLVNYGIGFGYLCVGLSVYIYSRYPSPKKYLSILPAVIALGMYQGMIPVLISAYFIFLLSCGIQTKEIKIKPLIEIMIVVLCSGLLYYLIHLLMLKVLQIKNSAYIESSINIDGLWMHFSYVVNNLLKLITDIYSGSRQIYSVNTYSILVLVLVLVANAWYIIILTNVKILKKVILMLGVPFLLLLPFISGLLTFGSIPLRSLLSVPLVVAGLLAFIIKQARMPFRYLLGFVAVIVIFQSIVSLNSLFVSSHLALQSDRVTAARIIERIETISADADQPIQYLEVVGFFNPSHSSMIHESEVIGASFFEWDQGSTVRIIEFLETMGLTKYSPATIRKRAELVSIAELMPKWPSSGSVVNVGDTIVIKLDDYSTMQKLSICQTAENQKLLNQIEFCN